ncbi:unnamed protein product [Oikopleura dioica]|uniref:Uncharacterized protein n=1 Tax=Oikopleura dioica TaxID=34765 RepID=E4XMW2_OIKDI|nr:unnamed protein product [Oikopleura dioica]
MQIPLRKTTPSPIVNSRPLNPPVPDHIQAPEAAPEAVPEKEVQNTPVGHDDTVFFDCETDLNSPRNSTNTPGAPIPEEPQVPLNPPENAPWGEIAPINHIPLPPARANTTSTTRRKIAPSRQPSSASPAKTRSQARTMSFPSLEDLIGGTSRSFDPQTTLVTFTPGQLTPVENALPPSDYDPDKDSLQLTSDESLPASPKTVPPPPPKKRKADPAPEPLTITR